MIKINKILGILILILILINGVCALGITPGRTSIDLSPNLKKISAEATVSVYNTEHKDLKVAITVEGELKDYIKLQENVINFKANEESKPISYNVDLSSAGGLSPGLHNAEIIVTEVPSEMKDEGTTIKATVSVVTKVDVYVTYPGKHLEAAINSVMRDGKMYFYIPLVSRGNESINKVYSKINIIDTEGKQVDSLSSDETSLGALEKKELSLIWDKTKNGKFKAKAVVYYDDKTIEIEKDFTTGTDVSIIGVSVNEFKLGSIAKIKVLVKNQLGSEIKNSVASLKVYDENLKKIEDLKSESYDVPANSNKEMIIYWDTEKLNEGTYDSDLNINFEDKFSEKKFKIDVKKTSMTFSATGYAVSVESSGKLNLMTLLIIVVVILVIINIVWLVIWFKRSKNKKKKE